MQSYLKGHFLIASPYLSDRNFMRSVVLIVSHDDEHAFGLLLNRQGYGTLAEAWKEMTGDSCQRAEKIRCGGPLEGPIMLLHQDNRTCDSQIGRGICISTTPESVAEIVRSNASPVVAVAGYAGWGPGQLEEELHIGGWMTLRASKDVAFADPNVMWKQASLQVTDTIMPEIHTRHIPLDPRLN